MAQTDWQRSWGAWAGLELLGKQPHMHHSLPEHLKTTAIVALFIGGNFSAGAHREKMVCVTGPHNAPPLTLDPVSCLRPQAALGFSELDAQVNRALAVCPSSPHAVLVSTAVHTLGSGWEAPQGVRETLPTASGLQSWPLLRRSSWRSLSHLTHILSFNYTNRFPKAMAGMVQSASRQNQEESVALHSPPLPGPSTFYLLQI